MLVQPQQAATVCELDLVQTRHQVMETGSNLGSPTNSRRTAHEPLNLTLDLEHAHVSGHYAVLTEPQRATYNRAVCLASRHASNEQRVEEVVPQINLDFIKMSRCY